MKDPRSMFHGATAKIFRRAEGLRNNMTEAEKILWKELRSNQLDGYRFKAQHPISTFVVDFYCHKLKLVIEVDGSIHGLPDQKEYDEGRTYELASLGLKVIRISNEDIFVRLEEVKDMIKKVMLSRAKFIAPNPLKGYLLNFIFLTTFQD